MEQTAQILIVDDEKNIRKILCDTLSKHGYQTHAAENAQAALRLCEQINFDLALIDLKMPGSMDGLALLSEIHARWSQMIVIMLTAFASLDSSIAALRRGAYDYLIKPATIEEILDSVARGLEKKRQESQQKQVITQLEQVLQTLKQDHATTSSESSVDDRFVQTPLLTIDRKKRLVACGDQPLALSPTEFDVLDYLASHADRVITASELVQAIQGYDLVEADARPLIRVHIQHLRDKLEDDPEHPRYILNVRGKGYRFVG